MILKLRSTSGGCLYQLSDCRIKNGFYMFDFYCFPGQCHFFLLRTTNCSHHIYQLQQQLFAAARHSQNWWALSGFPVSNMEQGWSASVHRAVWGLRDPAAEPGRRDPETPDSENDRTGSWNPHRYGLLTTSKSVSSSFKSMSVCDSDQNIQNPAPRDERWPSIHKFTLSMKRQAF